MGLTEIIMILVPIGSGLFVAAFRYPEFYRKHLSSPMFAAPFLIMIVALIWFVGYSGGASDQLAADRALARDLALAMGNVTDQRFLPTFGASTLFWLMLAIALHYLASVSPHRESNTSKAESP